MNDHQMLAGARKTSAVPSHDIGRLAPSRRSSGGSVRNSSSHGKPRNAANSMVSGSSGPSLRRLPSAKKTVSKNEPEATW